MALLTHMSDHLRDSLLPTKYDESQGTTDSFSANHDLPYSCIAVQEANLYYHYPHIYWQCAVLTVNASANEENEDNKSTNYGKMASAVSNMQAQGVKIVLPDINKAEFGFSPDAENNQIIFGLKAISGVGDDDATQIIANRPYTSLKDFVDKNHFGRSTMVALIKAGCFDTLENLPRWQIMTNYLKYQASLDNTPKTKLTMANFKALVDMNLIPDDKFGFEKKLALFRSYVFAKEFMIEKDTYRCDLSAAIFFENHLFKIFKYGVDYEYRGDTLVLFKKPFEKFYKTAVADMVAYVTNPELVKVYNDAVIYWDALETWEKYCQGTIPKWEMDALSFYYTEHELTKVSAAKYGLDNFNAIPAEPVVIGSAVRKIKDKTTGEVKNSTWDKYQLYRIAGTVLDKNKNKHSLTLLTTDGVVTVKFYAEAFAHYDKQVSKIDPVSGKKTVLEKSWFARGNKLLITGIRRGDTFFPKKYQDSIYQHTVCLITSVSDTGNIEMSLERTRV